MPPVLPRQLRDARNPSRRLNAARALGELERIEHVPLLIRSAVEDPDPAVRAAAREALQALIGAQTELSIQAYRSAPDEDDWLVELEEGDGAEDEASLSSEEEQYLTGLITVLRNYSDPRLRLKAIRQLESSSDLRVIAALAETVLWTDDADVRQAAHQSLEGRFGAETDEIIQSYQLEGDFYQPEDDEKGEAWDEDDTDADEQPEAGTVEAPRWQAPQVSFSTAPQVVREEGIPMVVILLAGVGVVVVLLIAAFVLGR